MQNKYPAWKYILIIVVTILGFVYALPNIYGEDPAIQIKVNTTGVAVDDAVKDRVSNTLKTNDINVKAMALENNIIMIRFPNTDAQLKAQDVIKAELGPKYTVAINIAPATPTWLESIGAAPMKYGLDLRGGVHFMLEVDIDGVIARREQGIIKSIAQELRDQRLRYAGIKQVKDQGVFIRFRNPADRDTAMSILKRNFPNLIVTRKDANGAFTLRAQISPAELNNIRQYTIEQTMSILRNRVNELGVGDAVVQSQGANRVAVDLPGIQDAAHAQQILGGTATLEFRMVDQVNDPRTAAAGMVPVGSKLYSYQGRPTLLKNQVILSGDAITSAVAAYDQQTGQPSVNIQLGGGNDALFSRTTRQNVGKLMAIVYVETKANNEIIDGKVVRTNKKIERVISVATIQSALGTNFQITGLSDPNESRNLALLLRAGALPAAIYPVEERTVGPSLGMENIRRGMISLEVGMGIILLIMVLYYRLFGLIADIALLMNLILLVACLSIIGSTLTLPGIAGIVLTVGMAVDANVLIYERIREELRNGITPHAAIYAGYERAFATIVDANVTTLIVAVVLFAIGTGPVKGFAVVLAIGLMTSMLTSITFTRAIVNQIYKHKSIKRLSIGI